jgi:hypothetical protein
VTSAAAWRFLAPEEYFVGTVQLVHVDHFFQTVCFVDFPDAVGVSGEVQYTVDGRHELGSVLLAPCWFQPGILLMTAGIQDMEWNWEDVSLG